MTTQLLAAAIALAIGGAPASDFSQNPSSVEPVVSKWCLLANGTVGAWTPVRVWVPGPYSGGWRWRWICKPVRGPHPTTD